ncbi:DUF3094 family protein [Parendozoicomonas haliclonae]|uniref:DUF3094 domain-containing protein n=1 Tax=Parendozoicomonas haliclonae TaxID=1960125 RepID=A0A1X7AEL7_9GAMM|nr:DUF3094 family protein [Parendozoicomonas haliclonae]SMA34487.1 hypothetical protein EHSB41UT_00404 [Parendozoicomonas haliclonae]
MAQKDPEAFITRLNDDDQQLVNEYISSGVNTTERKPFRPWIMMMWLSLSIIVLGVAARTLGYFFGH